MPDSSAPVASTLPTPAPAPTEIVIRPDGLRHGRWEAPKWSFYGGAGVIVLIATLYALRRMGALRRRKSGPGA